MLRGLAALWQQRLVYRGVTSLADAGPPSYVVYSHLMAACRWILHL